MARDNLQEAFKPLPPCLDHLVREAALKHLAWELGDVDAGGLALEDVAERLKVRVPPPDGRVAHPERGDVGLRRTRGLVSFTGWGDGQGLVRCLRGT